jgi:hypothetical protein
VKVVGVVGADLWCFREQPVGEAAVADLSVGPGADARDDVHAVLCAELHEPPQVLLAGPVPLVFDLFVVDPDDVGRDDLHACRLHLEDLGLPLAFGDAGVVHLAHHREPGLAIEREVLRIEAEGVAGRGAGLLGDIGVIGGAGRRSRCRSVDGDGCGTLGTRRNSRNKKRREQEKGTAKLEPRPAKGVFHGSYRFRDMAAAQHTIACVFSPRQPY